MGFKKFLLVIAIIPFFLMGCKRDSPYRPMRIELDNGLVILTQKFESLPVVAISVWAKIGSAFEEKGWEGISHFQEHMLFRKIPPSGKRASIQSKIEGAGGYLNGATGKDTTYYYAVVPKDFAREALYLLLDLFLAPNFVEKDFLEEKKVIIEEISRKQDSPSDLIEDLLYETVYVNHPYGHSVLGDLETVKNMDLDMLSNFHKTFYHPGNMVISIVGDFNQKEVINELRTQFARETKKVTPSSQIVQIKEGVRQKVLEKNVNQIYLTLGFSGPAVKDEDHLALDVLAVILGEGASSRLVSRLKEREKLVQEISVHFFTQKLSGLFAIYAQFPPENLEKVERIIWEEIEHIKDEPIEIREVEKAKNMIEANFHFQHETFKDQALAHAYWECLGATNYEKTYLTKIKKLNPAALKRVATKYLDADNFARVVIKPPSY